jgi:hypothetical protein
VCHLEQLALAFYHYHDTYGRYPPAYLPDANGKPMHSWRVLILPFLNESGVYEKYDFSEPWNGPNNRELADRIFHGMFQCPSGPHYMNSPVTDYVVIVGSGTPFPGGRSTSLADMRDGPENTILLAEIANSTIHWMEPRDLTVEEMSFVINDRSKPSISSPHVRGPLVVFADRIGAYCLDVSLRPETLKALITIAGGERVSKASLVRRDPSGRDYLAE